MTERTDLIPLVSGLSKARVLVVGDVMLDHFHYGAVERISPEAPIPVLRVEREEAMLGGAGNVVRNLRSLSAEARFVTITGKDPAGRDIARLVKKESVRDAPLIDDARRTSTKTRYIAGVQQVLRADRETTTPLDAKVEAKLIRAVSSAMRTCQVVVLSDYGKGALSAGTVKKIIRLAGKAKKAVIVDPKGSDFSRYRGADLITPNRRELAEATAMDIRADNDVVRAAKRLIKQNKFGAVLTTRSADGMTIVTSDGAVSHLAAETQEVFDVSGAGDTVVAAVAAALGAGVDLDQAARLANVAAGIVVGKVGTSAVLAPDLIAALHHQDLSSAEAKVFSHAQTCERIDLWRRAGHSVGFTNGCFDLLHPGHVSLLKQARRACGRLIVGLNSDASVRGLKGDGRPVQNEAARATVLASLASVDAVVIFDERTPLKLITALKPDVLVKGADYNIDTVVGADMVKKYGGKVKLAKLEPGHSTSATIARMGRKPAKKLKKKSGS
ncbi:MAG: D-glycero-beta-D-manno-heptose-7-phosphate kinase [Alphaproteobacteria bacterium]|jgi:D-beta-D-heptose 7-phosphate kinase / D-beta-D-heptose 1-phosphate adenosyltransferase|nr:D-glycero-beta-D-manno-heptose-7-phosphate kinase [Alphaproteobacteria bacterium]MBT7944306.1 D-glycero-beta-D-manno-heptose-7-phosphate kinase [Alphaproteobacteria bacterium]